MCRIDAPSVYALVTRTAKIQGVAYVIKVKFSVDRADKQLIGVAVVSHLLTANVEATRPISGGVPPQPALIRAALVNLGPEARYVITDNDGPVSLSFRNYRPITPPASVVLPAHSPGETSGYAFGIIH